jgi:hypothetical protein
MLRRTPYVLRAALLFSSLLAGSVSAFAQTQPHLGLPSVNLGLPVPSRIEPPKLPVDATVTVRVPSVGGLTSPLNATVGVGGSGPGVPPLPLTSSQAIVEAPQVAEKQLELLPTCR